jgi:hypothetical protein
MSDMSLIPIIIRVNTISVQLQINKCKRLTFIHVGIGRYLRLYYMRKLKTEDKLHAALYLEKNN